VKDFFKHLKGDAFGGITAGIVALPLALAFGVSSGLGPSAGLYGAIFIAFFAALFGGTSTQISGPTAPMTAVSMVVIASIVSTNDGDASKALPIILTVFLLAGLIQIGLGLLGIGKYIKYIPYPVVSGFMTAIGVMIIITQILPALGYYPKEDTDYVDTFKPQANEVILDNILKDEKGEEILAIVDFEEAIKTAKTITPDQINTEAKTLAASNASGVVGAVKLMPKALKNINFLELILALATILIIYGFKRITKAVPSTLVALIVVSGVAYFAKLDYRSIQEIPFGFPLPNTEIFTSFSLSAITPYILASVSLAFLGTIDSLLTSVIADNMTKTKHKPNKELVGQGIGNAIASIFGGIPGAGATIRTVVNINAGGKTKLSGMIAAVLLLVILLALGPVASKIPAAVLAGILLTVGIGVMDYKGLKAIPNLPRDINLFGLKLSSEVLIMLIVLILSVFWNLINAVGIGLVLSSFQELSQQISDTASHVILRMDKVPYMDQSGVYAVEDTVLALQLREISVYIVGVQKQPLFMMERIDIVPDLIPKEYIFKTFDECMTSQKFDFAKAYSITFKKGSLFRFLFFFFVWIVYIFFFGFC